jgi:cytochrome c
MFRFGLRTVTLSLALAAVACGLAPKKAPDPAKGKEVFEQCAACHNVADDEKKVGPSLRGLFKKAKLTNGKKPTDQNVLSWIDTGGNGMPPFKDLLSDEEKAHLLAYLKTL